MKRIGRIVADDTVHALLKSKLASAYRVSSFGNGVAEKTVIQLRSILKEAGYMTESTFFDRINGKNVYDLLVYESLSKRQECFHFLVKNALPAT